MFYQVIKIAKNILNTDIEMEKGRGDYVAKTLWKDIVLSLGTSFPDQNTRQWFQIHSFTSATDKNCFTLSFSHQFLSHDVEAQKEMVRLVEYQFRFAQSSDVKVVKHSCSQENRVVLYGDIHFSIKENIPTLGKRIKSSLERTKDCLMRHGRTENPLMND